MDRDKQRLIELFRQNVFGRTPDLTGRHPGHDGAGGHWLEEQFGIHHNANVDG